MTALVIIILYMDNVTAQDTPPPTPQVWNRTQLNFGKQFFYFKHSGSYFHKKSTAHLFTNYNFTRIFLQYEKINKIVVLFLKKANSRIGNTTQWLFKPDDLFDKIRNTENSLRYLCTLINCKIKIASAESLLPKSLELESSYDLYDFASNLARSYMFNNTRHEMTKRQAILAAGLGILGGAEFGISFFNHQEISALKDELDRDKNKIYLVSSELKHQDLMIATLADRTFTLRRKVNILIRKANELEFIEAANTLVRYFSVAYHNIYIYANALSQMLVTKTFQPQFFQEASLRRGMSEIKKLAGQAGLDITDGSMLELLSRPVSVMCKGDDLFWPFI